MKLNNVQPSMNVESVFAYAKKFGMNTIPEEYQTEELAMMVVADNPLEYGNLKPELKKNHDVAMLTASLDGWMLFYAPDEIKDDKEVVFAAIKRTEGCLYLASERLQQDPELLEYANNQENYNEFGDGITNQYNK